MNPPRGPNGVLKISRPSSQSPQKERSDRQLLKDLEILIHRDHRLEAELIAVLGEVDARRLYLEQAHPSMFHYCVAVLHFAEGVAYKRIAVARAAREHPELLAALEAGDLHLTAASLIAPHLTVGNAADWLALARHGTAQQIRQRIADRKPKPELKTSVRRAPRPNRTARPASGPENGAAVPAEERIVMAEATSLLARPASLPAASPAPLLAAALPLSPCPLPQPLAPLESPVSRQPGEPRKARCEPLGAERYCIRFVADEATHAQLQELQSLLRPSIPDADMGKILTRAIGVLLKQVRKQKIAGCSSPRRSKPGFSATPSGKTTAGSRRSERSETRNPSRHIPAAIRREVWKRDEGRCTFRSHEGRQCGSTQYLEFHHQVPWARCREHTTSNIALRCRAHNQYEEELAFGVESMVRFRRRSADDRVRDLAGDLAIEGFVAQGDTGVGTRIAGREGDLGASGASGSQLELIPVR